MRYGAAVMAVVLALGAPAPRAEEAPAEARESLATVCNHYVNRARFKPRGDRPEFVVTLADGCVSALRSLDTGQGQERETAMAFLAKLQVLRDLIIDMNMTRVFGAEYTPVTHFGYGATARAEQVPKVSAAGEYLIAYNLGLIAAMNAWLDTGPDFALVQP